MKRRVWFAEDVLLESGQTVPAGRSARVFSEGDGTGRVVGIEWTDREGNHAMAIETAKIRDDPPPDEERLAREIAETRSLTLEEARAIIAREARAWAT